MKKMQGKNTGKNKHKNEIVFSPSPDNSLQFYLQTINKFPLLSRTEEEKLSKLFYKNKDPKISQILSQANLRFVVKVAAEYTRFGSKLIDLIQEGNVGLLHAIKEFNPYKGVRLISYAVWWIRGYIQEYLMRQYSMVRIGTNTKQKKLFYLLLKEQKKLAQLPYTDNTKLLTYSGFKQTEIQSMKNRLNSRDISLDQPTSTNTNSSYVGDLYAQVETPSLEESFNFSQEKLLLQNSLQKLRPKLNTKELYILKHRLLKDTPDTLQKIGDKFLITREAIRQIENRLLKKIKAQIINVAQNQKT